MQMSNICNNHKGARNYNEENFSVLVRARGTLKARCSRSLMYSMFKAKFCKQKKIIYQTRLFKFFIKYF